MTQNNTKGFLLFAFSNTKVDYLKMAHVCALSIKKNLKINSISLVTDNQSLEYLKSILTDTEISECFDNILLTETPRDKNDRELYDSPWTKISIPFINANRNLAYDITPYDETIVLDIDYVVLTNNFDNIWNNNLDFLVNKEARDLRNEPQHKNETRLNGNGIPMYWATILYFKKNENAKTLFNLVKFIKENYQFYKFVYKFPGNTFRNDYVFSIAIHILNGFLETDKYNFPNKSILTMSSKDDIVEVNNNRILMLSHDTEKEWENILVNVKEDVHIMNKLAMNRHYKSFLKMFKKDIDE